MQKRIRKPQKSQAFIDTEVNCMSFMPVNRNGWWIKFSTYHSHNILIFFVSQFTGEIIIRYFNNEDDAVKFINYVCDLDPNLPVFENNLN